MLLSKVLNKNVELAVALASIVTFSKNCLLLLLNTNLHNSKQLNIDREKILGRV